MAIGILQNIYLFRELTPSELEPISRIAHEVPCAAGQEIFLRGSSAEAMYVIKYGNVVIRTQNSAGDDMTISTLSSGAHFGEMPFLDNEKRSASAICNESSTLVEIKYADLKNVLEKNDKIAIKVYRAMAAYLGGRLRVTTEDLNYSREQNMKHF
jgi:CRP-like cAMP-binding protein